jgi:hypothetical protein
MSSEQFQLTEHPHIVKILGESGIWQAVKNNRHLLERMLQWSR